jgi:hypothetical protein
VLIRNIMVFTLALLLLLGTNISNQPIYAQTSAASAPYNNFGPVTDYSVALADSSSSTHIKKGGRYNINDDRLPELGESSEPNLFDLPRSHTSKPTAPSEDDLIVVGTVTGGQSYLSNDKRNIYSEFKVSLREVIQRSAAGLAAGQSIDIERNGGAIRLPSGKILQRGSLTQSMPQVGKRYVFILRSKEDTGSFILKTGYQLEDNHVYCLDDDKKSVTLSHPLKEHGGTESQLIENLRKWASAGKGVK